MDENESPVKDEPLIDTAVSKDSFSTLITDNLNTLGLETYKIFKIDKKK